MEKWVLMAMLSPGLHVAWQCGRGSIVILVTMVVLPHCSHAACSVEGEVAILVVRGMRPPCFHAACSVVSKIVEGKVVILVVMVVSRAACSVEGEASIMFMMVVLPPVPRAACSVEGKMLKRAGDKMALERIVIKKGAFQDLCSGGKGKEVRRPLCGAEFLSARV
eukprot:385443-Pelagomonas_calceolata.AAC.4